MNEFKSMIEETESLKQDLILLNNIFDDLMKPWLLFNDDKIENFVVKNEFKICDDIQFLNKFCNLLKEVDKVENKDDKKVSVKNKSDITMTVVKETALSSYNTVKHDSQLKKSVQSASVRNFTPAHRLAPFKTDHNLHRAQPRINYLHKVPSKYSSKNVDKRKSIIKEPPSKRVIVIKKEDVQKKEVETSLRTNSDSLNQEKVALGDRRYVFNQLQEEIRKLEKEEREPLKTETMEMKPVLKRVFEARGKLKIPLNLRKVCNTQSKLISKLEAIFIRNINTETQSTVFRSRCSFVESVLEKRGHLAMQSRRILVLEQVLDKLAMFCGCLDLPSCTPQQLAFLRSCLSWALTEFATLLSLEDESDDEDQIKTIDRSDSEKVRSWLEKARMQKQSSKTATFWDQVLQTAVVTNCTSIISVDNGDHGFLTASLRRQKKAPMFRFSADGGVTSLSVPSKEERRSRESVIHLQTKVFLGSLLSGWSDLLKQKAVVKKDNHRQAISISPSPVFPSPCTLYRHLYGLLLDKSPVLLRDNS